MKFNPKLDESTVKLLSQEHFSYDDVVAVLRLLRGKNGCPWDRVQTHKSIKANVIEEAYELVDAIDKADNMMMREEIGDLLMQCVFNMQIAEDDGEFVSQDVFDDLCKKLIMRHTHIFGDDTANDAKAALDTWEKNKIALHDYKTTTEYMRQVPLGMPSLMRANKVQHRAAKVGFDWDDVSGALDKTEEEFAEVREAIKCGDKQAISDELGDLMFAMVNICRFMGVEPETALTHTTEKFINRVNYVEQALLEQGKKMFDSNLEEMDALWNDSKKHGL